MLDRLKSNWKLAGGLLALVLLILAVMLACWKMWAPEPAAPEVYAPAAQQADLSVVLEKKPDTAAKPVHKIPKGAKVERIVSVTVQPRAVQPVAPVKPFMTYTTGSGILPAPPTVMSPAAYASAPCPPVTVDLSLLVLEDKTWRVIASSPDGQVVGGVDIPVQDAEPPPAPKLWAAGLVMNPFRRTGGAFVDRDVGFLRLGVQLNQRDIGEFPTEGYIKAGIRW